GGRGEREAEEPDLRCERAHEAGEQRLPPDGEAACERGTVERDEPRAEQGRLNPERPDERRRRAQEVGSVAEREDADPKAHGREREQTAGRDPEQQRLRAARAPVRAGFRGYD